MKILAIIYATAIADRPYSPVSISRQVSDPLDGLEDFRLASRYAPLLGLEPDMLLSWWEVKNIALPMSAQPYLEGTGSLNDAYTIYDYYPASLSAIAIRALIGTHICAEVEHQTDDVRPCLMRVAHSIAYGIADVNANELIKIIEEVLQE